MTSREFQQRALALPEATEAPHFERTSFRVRNKIFATLAPEKAEAVLKLSPVDQAVFTGNGGGAIYPVPNKWGQQGWTIVELEAVEGTLLEAALACAYKGVAPKSLGDRVG